MRHRDATPVLPPHLSRSVDHVFVGAEFAQPHGAARVQPVGADADFRAESELEAVVEPRAGIPKHGGAVDRGLEATGRGFIARDDRVAVR
jgi:hypothetical protein